MEGGLQALQALGAGFLVVLGTMIVGWGCYVTVKLMELEERLDRQDEILFKLKNIESEG